MRRRTFLSASLGSGLLGGLSASSASRAPTMAADQKVAGGLKPYSDSGLAFGTTVSIQVLHDSEAAAQAAIRAALQEVRDIDALMSLHQVQSQVHELNQRGVLISAHEHLRHVVDFAQQLSILTAGAFDITVQPLWLAFSRAAARGELPTPGEIAAAKSLVGWRRVEMDPLQLRLPTPGMAITLNGVAQGYAVDLALKALRAHGVQHALLDTGEFGAVGHKANGRAWQLGVGDPRRHDAILATLRLDGRMVATSGDYETFFSPDFVHHHIFDPATGDSPPELASVTVLAPTGILADGLSTAFMVMGASKSLALASRIQDVDLLLIHKNGAVQKTARFPESIA